jgi:hypothetical protein
MTGLRVDTIPIHAAKKTDASDHTTSPRHLKKIFCDKNGKVTPVPYREHMPPEVTAQIFWLSFSRRCSLVSSRLKPAARSS